MVFHLFNKTLAFGNKFCYILNTNLSFLILILYTVTHHGHAEWASHGNGVGPGAERFLSTLNVNILSPPFRLFEHLRATRAAAQSGRLATFHFDEFSVKGGQNFPGRCIHLVRSAQDRKSTRLNSSHVKRSYA